MIKTQSKKDDVLVIFITALCNIIARNKELEIYLIETVLKRTSNPIIQYEES